MAFDPIKWPIQRGRLLLFPRKKLYLASIAAAIRFYRRKKRSPDESMAERLPNVTQLRDRS